MPNNKPTDTNNDKNDNISEISKELISQIKRNIIRLIYDISPR